MLKCGSEFIVVFVVSVLFGDSFSLFFVCFANKLAIGFGFNFFGLFIADLVD